MKIIIQRTSYAKVTVNLEIVAKIEKGFLVLVGFSADDDASKIPFMVDKIINMRIFEDEDDKMNLSLADVAGGLIIVPNFTLYADARKGRRPNFTDCAKQDEALALFNEFIKQMKIVFPTVQCGIFQADMKVELLNDGPVTIVLER